MKFRGVGFAGVLLFIFAAFRPIGGLQMRSGRPRYTPTGELTRPRNYREWIFLSSGFGMEYNAGREGPKMFTNVFVTPFAYRQFVATGKWPDGTMFALEERLATSKGSINKSGVYQTGLAGLAVSVKEGTRFSEQWAYFSFSAGQRASQANPKSRCWTCHNEHGAVDNTFVQFYPTLKSVAQKLGVYDEVKSTAPPGRP
jgi:Cytochrome P460